MSEPDPALLRWVTTCVDPGASVVSATGLRRGEPPWLLTLSNSDIEEVVVRVGDESSVALLATEMAALETIADSGIPGPRLLGVAMGGPDAPDVFALVMTRVPGTSRSSVEPSTARLRAVGEAVAIVHAAPVPTSPHLPVRRRPVEPVDFDAARRSQPARPLLIEAENVLRLIPMPDHEPVFVHGDFWHGNTMWVDDQLTGIVDWECAGTGHPGIDLGMQRCDAALVVGPSGADDVLAGYESAIGHPAADVAYWDIAAALTTPPTMELFIETIIGQGRTDLDPPALLSRRDDFLAAALDRLGRVMFTRPIDIADADLVAILAEGWSLDDVSVDYLAVGFGSHHWRATTASSNWFVTVDDLVAKRREPEQALQSTRECLIAALATAAELRDVGFEFVVAPVRTDSGHIAHDLGDRYVVAVYPLVPGRTYDYGTFADDAHRDAVVRDVAMLHCAPASCRRFASTETFSIARHAALFAACEQLRDTWEFGPFADPARRLLARHGDAVAGAFDTFDRLATDVSSQPQRFVLTHGEPHPANTITTDRGVVLVDWDTALIAPPERDLWGLVDGEPSVTAEYEALTGIDVDQDAIEFYRLAWDLSEIAIYISDFRQPHERTEDMSEAWQNLDHFLDPARW